MLLHESKGVAELFFPCARNLFFGVSARVLHGRKSADSPPGGMLDGA
jgi:hypothetical protein